MKRAFPVTHVSVSQRGLADEPGLGLTVLLCTVRLGLSGGTSVSPRIPLPPELGGWRSTLFSWRRQRPLHRSPSCHIEAGGRPDPKSGGGETAWWRGGWCKVGEHHWEFDERSGTTASDRDKGFGAGTEPHAVVGAGEEVSIWLFPLNLALTLRSSGPAVGRERQTDRGSQQRPRGAQVSLCLQAQGLHSDRQGGWRSCWCACGRPHASLAWELQKVKENFQQGPEVLGPGCPLCRQGSPQVVTPTSRTKTVTTA